MCMHVCLCVVIMCTWVYVPWRQEEDVRSLRAGVIGGWKLPDVGAGKKHKFSESSKSLLTAEASLQPLQWWEWIHLRLLYLGSVFWCSKREMCAKCSALGGGASGGRDGGLWAVFSDCFLGLMRSVYSYHMASALLKECHFQPQETILIVCASCLAYHCPIFWSTVAVLLGLLHENKFMRTNVWVKTYQQCMAAPSTVQWEGRQHLTT